MDKRVPLAAALSVELDLVIVAMGLQRRFFKVNDFVDEAFASEARGLDGSYGPIEGDMDSFFGFRVGCFDDFWSQEVECAVDVLLAVFIPETPCAA